MIEAEPAAAAARNLERPASPRQGRVPASMRLREALLRTMAFYWDAPVELARLMQRVGMKRAAMRFLSLAYDANAWDAALGEILCDAAFELGEAEHAPGSEERAAFIMRVLARSYPSERVVEAYFVNLDAIMRGKERQSEPGLLVLGMGVGRVGSTTLAGIMQSNPRAIATHELPPRVWRVPHPRQVEFHKRRFRLLLPHAPLVFDGAPWWVHLADEFFAEFPSSKAIGLYRDVEATVNSLNQLSPPFETGEVRMHNGVWLANSWSPILNGYAVPDGARKDRDGARRSLYRRRIIDYKERMDALAARHPGRVLLLRTEELDEAATRTKIADFTGVPVTTSHIRLNAGNANDSLYHAVWL